MLVFKIFIIFTIHSILVNLNHIIFLENPNFNIFAFENGLCPICYSKIYIPTYSKNCNHIFCYCCIIRWITKKNTCPICRKKISQIGYISSDTKNGNIIINVGDFNINSENNLSEEDSKYCIKCGKSEPCNQLLLCNDCKFNLAHISCSKIDSFDFQNFKCAKCKK